MGVSKDSMSNDTKQSETSSSERPPSYSDDPVAQLSAELKLNLQVSFDTKSISRDECVAHLKFLAVLADLRENISGDDGLFGINDFEADRFPESINEARARIREKRWAVYTARAVDRYTVWWATGLPRSRPNASLSDVESADYENIINPKTLVAWSPDNLPPIDILMVWHAHSLNPRNYLEDCIRYGKMSTWKTGFPWEVIDSCIDNRKLEFTVSDEAQKMFEQKLNIRWNNLHDPPTKTIQCPRCINIFPVQWTEGLFGETVENAFRFGDGYADNSFQKECSHCHYTVDHGRLKVAKFRKDLEATIYADNPMPGSFTNLHGIPEGPTDKLNHPSLRHMLFPTRLMQAVGPELLNFTDPRVDWCKDIQDLRKELEPKLRDRKALLEAHGGAYMKRLVPAERIHFRRLMSRYWDNLGPFSLDLVGAVIRQGTFISKMDQIDWLHSPTVMETMDRLIKKYEVFFSIMMNWPKNMAVPTLDVDLAWHTHQLNPSRYYTYSTKQANKAGVRVFIDHDDKVDEDKLSDGFSWTSKTYRRITNGGVYSECTCWYCEAIRTPDLYDRVITVGSASRARDAADSLHDRPDISSDPNKNPHISAHNAVRPTSLYAPTDRLGSVHYLQLKSNYQKAARRAEKRVRQRSGSKSSISTFTSDKGKEKGRDKALAADPYYMPYAYGYPIFVPLYYAPYMADPCINSDSYASNPGCMNMTPGAAGNCCSGTCGGAVAAGGCGGGGCGGGGCGSSAGGCGGGGGGCGGGGGGCGGGGGGGGGGCGGGGGGGC